DASEVRASGLLEWLIDQGRLLAVPLPLALTDFLLSLRDWARDGTDPFPIAEQAEADANLRRQVSFYRSRLRAFVADAALTPRQVVPDEIGKRFADIFDRIGDKEVLTLALQQSFESMSPRVLSSLHE